MKKSIILFMSFIYSAFMVNSCAVQKLGKVQYYDENDKLISEWSYKKRFRKKDLYPTKTILNDTVINKLVVRELKGQFSETENKEVWDLLGLCKDEVSSAEFAVIYYEHGVEKWDEDFPDDYIRQYSEWSKKFLMERKRKVRQYGKGAELSYYFGEVQVNKLDALGNPRCKDAESELWNHFFGLHVRYSSYVAIRKDGYYYAYLGEYGDNVDEGLEELMLR